MWFALQKQGYFNGMVEGRTNLTLTAGLIE